MQNVILVGPMGAGKSTIGRLLAKELRLHFKDSDKEIEQRTGADIPWIFDVEGEQGFREREQSMVVELCELDGVVIATGGGVVLRPENRQALRDGGGWYTCMPRSSSSWSVLPGIVTVRCCAMPSLARCCAT